MALTNAEKQRRWRDRRNAELARLRKQANGEDGNVTKEPIAEALEDNEELRAQFVAFLYHKQCTKFWNRMVEQFGDGEWHPSEEIAKGLGHGITAEGVDELFRWHDRMEGKPEEEKEDYE